MKHLFTLLFLILGTVVVHSQVITVNEDFEASFPDDWSNEVLAAGSGWQQDWQNIGHESTHSAHPYINNQQCDSWLVSPQVSIVSATYELNFWELHEDVQYYDSRSVHISTGSGNPADGDFVEVMTFEETLLDWTQHTLDLSAYNGQNIYVGFQYEGTWHKWFVDDVSIAPTGFVDGALTYLTNPVGTGSIGMQNVEIEIKNQGTDVLNNVTITWDVNGNVQTPFSSTSLNLASGASTQIDLGNYNFNTTGQFFITAVLETPGDFDLSNNTLIDYYGITNPKEAAAVGISPEGMTPLTGLQDVVINISNEGMHLIDTVSVNWIVDDVVQTPYITHTLNLAPGETTALTIGQFDFETGVHEITATIDALGDDNVSNDTYLSYAAVDTFWESFEGAEFPPAGWEINFGVRDNSNFGNPHHGEYYYSCLPDTNMFGFVADTIYTPLMNIEAGDEFGFRIMTNDFLNADHNLVWKNGTTGEVTFIQNITSIQINWTPILIDISDAAGINYIGITSTPLGGPGHSKFDSFHSTANINLYQNDLAIDNGDLYFLALENQMESFDCVVKNVGAITVPGGNYTVKLMENGEVIASEQGVTVSSWQNETVTVNHTFSGISQHRLYFEIDFAEDQNLSNNTGRAADVNVVPFNSIINQIGQADYQNLNLPFTPNGSTMSLGEDDLSQTIYRSTDIPITGNIYGMVYTYDNLIDGGSVRHLPLRVRMKQTNSATLNGGWASSDDMVVLYDDTLEILPGNNREIYIPFDTPISYAGLSNIVIEDHQFDPEFPPSIMRMYAYDLPSGGSTRSISVSDVYQLDPNNPPEFYYSSEDLTYTQFVIEPIVDLSSVSGTVYGTDDLPLEGATVQVEGASISIETDENGFYTLPDLPYNDYELTASFIGYNDSTVTVTLSSESLTQDFYLVEREQVDLIGMVVGENAPSIPLENVSVSAEGYSSDNGYTNIDGEFILTEIYGVSTYEVSFSLYGYRDTTISVSVVNENVDMAIIELEQVFIPVFDVHIVPESNPLVKWKNPLKSNPVKLQNDFNVRSYSYTNEPNENVWLGNYFEIADTTTLTSVEFHSSLYEGAIDFISIDIFDANSEEVIATSQPFLIHADSVHTVDIPNIVVYGDVYAMIHWQDNAVSTNFLTIDYSNTNIPNTAFIKYPNQSPVLFTDFIGGEAPNMSFNIRINTLDDGNHDTNNEVLSYNIYRGLANEFPNISNWDQINAGPVSDLFHMDNDWENVDVSETYRYAVETIYTNGNSEVTFSEEISGTWLGLYDAKSLIESLRVFPVPTSDAVSIVLPEILDVDAQLIIYDATGKEVKQIRLNHASPQTLKFDISSFENGAYFLRIKSNDKIYNGKIIVSR